MFNPRVSGIGAGAGFLLSLLVGLVTGAHFPLILIRACIFAAVFFALASAGYGAIRSCLPELFAGESAEAPVLGGQVDISVGDDGEGEGDFPQGSAGLGDELNDFLENPGNSGAGTLDQTAEAVYTGEGEAGGIQDLPQAALPDGSGFPAGDAESVDMLPDLDAMSGAFTSGSVPVAGSAGPAAAADLPAGSFDDARGSRSGNKEPDDRFNVQEMASAIQTVLRRENKG